MAQRIDDHTRSRQSQNGALSWQNPNDRKSKKKGQEHVHRVVTNISATCRL